MYQWYKNVQRLIDEIDMCIKKGRSDALTLTYLAECYGVRLPADYAGEVPSQMLLIDVPEGEYIVFEHGPFDFETENHVVEAKIEKAMQEFDYAAAGYCLDTAPGRVFYFYHDCSRFWKYVRPVRKG